MATATLNADNSVTLHLVPNEPFFTSTTSLTISAAVAAAIKAAEPQRRTGWWACSSINSVPLQYLGRAPQLSDAQTSLVIRWGTF